MPTRMSSATRRGEPLLVRHQGARRPRCRSVAADESANDRDHEIGSIVTSIDGLVISDSLEIEADSPWAANTTVLRRAEGPAEIERQMQQDGGGDLLMFGSSTTWNPLLDAGLVDELVVLVGAALLGDGSKVYSGPRAGLHLLGARILLDSELVELRYAASTADH